ncbi:hypothetical protein EJ070_03180 [Mesorhizobium sp. M1E.F.Ca.ET.045.02.1.1]|uniref:hypothetical protein n=1 Tax=Mesorhizobium sp. M1E.F.Ca.ET.045.02.1.1 TaxID=2493672 RepID=UPI000F759B55|nr:hypothetical protein [Mesorhizobium sp. M1E.F.Ca.ET.045.02.1.1]AZO19766.1 hypothetical protein EJ070_03180 [Mesorhizobium sp. M1E.F.Ca.ET.045.02.1.1]
MRRFIGVSTTKGAVSPWQRSPKARLPRSKHYALGAEPGHAVLVEPWRVLLPAQTVDAAFEGV